MDQRFKALIEVAETFGSDLTQVIGRDDDGNVHSVGVIAYGESARRLAAFLETLES